MHAKMKTNQSRRCKVTGCVNKNKGCPLNVPLFKVPISNGPVLEKWVQETGDTDWLDVPIQYIKDNLRMCARHFLPTQLSVTAKQTRLRQPVAPTIFEDCVDRKPLTDEQIVAWRGAKHYGAHYNANLAKRKAQTEQLKCIHKQVIPNLQDHGSEIGSESGVTTSTEAPAEEVPTRFHDGHVPINPGRIHEWRQSEHYVKAFWNNASQPPDPKCNQSQASDFSSDEVPTKTQETASLAGLSKSGGMQQENCNPQNGQIRRTIGFVRCISINGTGQNIGPLLESLV